MAKNGLKNNLKPISILSIAKQAAEAAELRSKDRQRYSDSLLKYANLISVALKNKDINQLFDLPQLRGSNHSRLNDRVCECHVL